LATVLLLTPPFTQLNTPYPATAYIKGFLNTKNITSYQADLGIEVIQEIFSVSGLQQVFIKSQLVAEKSENAKRITANKNAYINTITDVVAFLQGKNIFLAQQICSRQYLPEANRFENANNLQWAFGQMGLQDKAKHLATLYLEDIADLIKECVDENFGFSRYAERLGRCANNFDALYNALQKPETFTDIFLLQKLENLVAQQQPKLVCISVPFPGNLYSALRCGSFIKNKYSNCKVAIGGGFANTELRSLTDARVFEFCDFITLDDGEAPLENLIKFINNDIDAVQLKRTFLIQNNKVSYIDNQSCTDYKQGQVGTPDYSDLHLQNYISAIEVANPMHSLWSDGRWNKLTMAHGCYWAKCTFCDVSLDYIKNYEPLTAEIICNRITEIIAQTGTTGFHFVDEAAPPALMRGVALELIKRNLQITWWANIRFEKSFTQDLCLLLKKAGCIAVSGGLEVASERLLQLIDKGITVPQVAQVTKHFTQAGIMVHAYLMYGYPTQTAQETVDSLEMVRQLFDAGVLQSGFWHLFTMTAHSPVGLNPKKFKVEKANPNAQITFANNDVAHIDTTGAQHDLFSEGLRVSLFNYMQGAGLDWPLQKWFDVKVPKTTVTPNYIKDILSTNVLPTTNSNQKIIFLDYSFDTELVVKTKKGSSWETCNITFYTPKENHTIRIDKEQGLWLVDLLPTLSYRNNIAQTRKQVQQSYEAAGLQNFELFWDNKPMTTIYKAGVLQL
jgi:hypothetical protein